MQKTLLALLLATSFAASPVYAERNPHPSGADARVQFVPYHSQDVVTVKGHYGYTSTIEFSPDETIVTVATGDKSAWQIVPLDNILFLKPLLPNAATNLVVKTSMRLYSFELKARDPQYVKPKDITYRIQFTYPEDDMMMLASLGRGPAAAARVASAATTPADWNFRYTYSGKKRLRPVRAFDNGQFTYLQFSSLERVPAIFVVDEHGNESLVNFHKEGDYIVLHRLGRQFTLRDGEDATCIFNEGFPETAYESEPHAPAARVEPVSTMPLASAETDDEPFLEMSSASEAKAAQARKSVKR